MYYSISRNSIALKLAIRLPGVSVTALAGGKSIVRGINGVVSSSSRFASEAGIKELKDGGNAVDAAVAAAFAILYVLVAEAGREVSPDDLCGNLLLPDKSMIDGFTGDGPVLVRRFDHKGYLANRKAHSTAGVRAGLPDPAGIAVEQDGNGEPTGALFNPVHSALESTVLVQDKVHALFEEFIPPATHAQRIQENS